MTGKDFIPRRLQLPLMEALEYFPVNLIHGPRQCGKTTLAQSVGETLGYSYFTLDDVDTHAFAQADPMGFIFDCPNRTILDEIQLAPELFRVIKLSVDRNRVPGRFILTGSANMLFVPELVDALTGRMQTFRLYPLSQQEIEQTESIPFLERLFAGHFQTRRTERLGNHLHKRIVAGGYPSAWLSPSEKSRSFWYQEYVRALIQKDILDLAKIRSADIIPKLLTLVASRSGQLYNVATLASQFEISRNTVNDYLTLLERQFLLDRLLPWYSNQMKRLVKKPKLHIGDTGLACTLLGVDTHTLRKNRTLLGQLLETFVFQELKRQVSSSYEPYKFYHYRDRDGVEVDMIIERGAFELVGIKVKAAASISKSDFRGLRKIKAAHGDRFKYGAVLYDGEICASFGDGLYGIPIRMLWENNVPENPA